MKKVWMIQERVFADGKFLAPKKDDIALYARKEHAKLHLFTLKEWAKSRNYKLAGECENAVRYFDKGGWLWSYTLYEKILFP